MARQTNENDGVFARCIVPGPNNPFAEVLYGARYTSVSANESSEKNPVILELFFSWLALRGPKMNVLICECTSWSSWPYLLVTAKCLKSSSRPKRRKSKTYGCHRKSSFACSDFAPQKSLRVFYGYVEEVHGMHSRKNSPTLTYKKGRLLTRDAFPIIWSDALRLTDNSSWESRAAVCAEDPDLRGKNSIWNSNQLSLFLWIWMWFKVSGYVVRWRRVRAETFEGRGLGINRSEIATAYG